MLPLLFAVLAGSATVQSESPPQTVVVIGQKISDAESKLQACLARGCPTNEDIDATLVLAETQLMAGKYRAARRTLLASLGRNKDEGKDYPIPVSDLYRANGKVAAHLGIDDDYYRSTFGIYRTLKYGLPTDDQRKYMALMEVAEMMYRTRGHSRARLYYERIAHDARRNGRDDIAAIAELRSAIRHLPPGSDMQMAEIRRIARLQGDKMKAPVLEARLALARVAYQKKDEAAAQEILRDLAAFDIKRPILIYSPPYEVVARELDSGSEFDFPLTGPPSTGGAPSGEIGGPPPLQARASITSNLAAAQWSTTKRMAGNFEDMWIDVAFRVTPDGKVSDAKIIRSKGDLFWTKPLMVSIAGRRYTPGKPNDPSSIRTERYTYTSGLEGQTSTRMAMHSPKARVEYIDLSDMAAPE